MSGEGAGAGSLKPKGGGRKDLRRCHGHDEAYWCDPCTKGPRKCGRHRKKCVRPNSTAAQAAEPESPGGDIGTRVKARTDLDAVDGGRNPDAKFAPKEALRNWSTPYHPRE